MIVLTRRRFLQLASAAALAPSSCVTPRTAAVRVNDVHSQLNETYVAAVRTPRSAEELREIVQRGGRSPICIAGGRHAMGGQQFASNATLIDIRSMKSVLSFDEERGIVEVESGIQWPELVSWLIDKQQGRQRQWGIAQKQTGADRLTLAGSLAANAHGRGLTMKPIAGDVESFTLINAAGDLLECSRSSNRELFALAIGGYGLFGPMASIRLRLRPRQKVERVVEEQTIDTVMNAMEQRIAAGYLYGDFQFSIDDASADFLKRGVFSCYRPVPNETPIAETQRELKPEDWGRLLFLAHADKKRVYEQYVGYYLTTTGQVYWSDEHQMSFYADDYHSAVDRALGPDTRRGTEMITELYVPRTRLADFMSAAAEELRRRKANVIYGTIRL
ncbi:MAG TPA: FAD-binding oxidoreductase, partial [Thermoanaerobaculia bacterium]|nr:FAD-binding oxidoreductase [Thermoanaerobaculia bacterium]